MLTEHLWSPVSGGGFDNETRYFNCNNTISNSQIEHNATISSRKEKYE